MIPTNPQNATLLVVDDEPSVLATIAAILQDEGYRVEIAASATEALVHLKREPFDVVLTDLRMEGESGLSLLAEIRKNWEGTVSLVLTGYASLESAVDSLREGAYDYLVKPSEVSELKATVARAVDRAMLARTLQERMADLDEANRKLRTLSDDLQKRVDQATAELQQNVADLEGAKRELEEEREAREQFISMVVHELSQPLSAISAFAQLLQRAEITGDARRRASSGIVSESRRLARLARDLTYASQLAHKVFEIEAAPFDLVDVVREQTELPIVGADQPVEISVPSEGLELNGDRDRLAQVVSNLIANAFRHAPGAAVHVTVARENGQAILTIEDNGPGIDAKQIELIFEPYVQLGGPHGAAAAGAGLGLYITRAIVEAHGGHINVSSEPGKGTTFKVALPLKASAD